MSFEQALPAFLAFMSGVLATFVTQNRSFLRSMKEDRAAEKALMQRSIESTENLAKRFVDSTEKQQDEFRKLVVEIVKQRDLDKREEIQVIKENSGTMARVATVLEPLHSYLIQHRANGTA